MKTENSNTEIDQLIGGFADGAISHDDYLRLRDWTHDSPEHEDYVRKRLRLMAAMNVSQGENFDVDAAISRFRRRTRTRTIPMWTKVAAAVAVVLIIALPFVFYNVGYNSVKDSFAEVRMEVPEGSQLNLTLPDGTKVRLNSGSTISYSQGYGINEREIRLTGEAYFTVAHNAEMPFSVKTRELTVNDIGTEFLFSNYADDSTAVVELYDGKVSLDNNLKHEDGFMLNPGESAIINKVTGTLSKTSVSTDKASAQQMEDITFDNATIANVARVLSRSYGKHVTVMGQIAEKRIYGVFNRKTESLDDILRAIAATGEVHYKIEKGKYVLY